MPTPRDETSENGGPSANQNLRRFVGAALAVYWLVLFAATHVPIRRSPVAIPGADKVVHFVGYGVLGLLLTFWIGLRRPLSKRVLLVTVLVLATYGAIDELLQIPVGRTCDIADWVFDLLGGGLGVLTIAALDRFRPRGAGRPV